DKKVYIAPFTPKTTMFASELQEQHSFTFLGFLDNFQEGANISKPSHINKEFDLILILSANHGNAIFEDFSRKLPQKKLIKVEQNHGVYHFLEPQEVEKSLQQHKSTKRKQNFLRLFIKMLDFYNCKRKKIVFISKGSITSNNKALFIHCYKEGLDVVMLTDNQEQYKELQTLNMPVVWLESWRAYRLMAQAKFTLQDQANITQEIMLLGPKQKTLQMWHGIPLKRLNKLTTFSYDYLISTSDFVNETTLSKVIEAKEYKDFGYPRNDLFLQESHDAYDLLFCDKTIYNFVKEKFGTNHKIALYMPTHRESNKAAKIPLDFEKLNAFLSANNMTLIVKLHHFVQKLYEDENYSNIFFHTTHGDIYPLLKYTDILITDYSSVYFDFLLLNRPIIFFDYDKEEYEANMQGFLYDYESFTPGVHAKTQEELHEALQKTLYCDEDDFREQREKLCERLYTNKDAKSAERIMERINATK
ncbi:MAG: CDP-glycerol glycerophosphotransferase family protein, partial [Sulfurimonas sp.]